MARYPEIRVSIRSPNPLALVAAVRAALRRRGVDRSEIRRFTGEALTRTSDPRTVRQICERWVSIANAGLEPRPRLPGDLRAC